MNADAVMPALVPAAALVRATREHEARMRGILSTSAR